MSSSKSDNELSRWVKFWNATEGRDKINKLVQYSFRFLAWIVSDRQMHSQLLSGSQSFADARKIFRLGKFLNEYLKLQDLIRTIPDTTDAVAHLLNIGARSSYFAYWVADAFVILTKVNILQGKMKQYTEKSFLFWFIGLIFSFLFNFRLLRLIRRKEVELNSQQLNAKTSEDLECLRSQKRTNYLNILRDCGDLIIASNGVSIPHLLVGRGFSDGFIGFGGTLSALISCYQQYPIQHQS